MDLYPDFVGGGLGSIGEPEGKEVIIRRRRANPKEKKTARAPLFGARRLLFRPNSPAPPYPLDNLASLPMMFGGVPSGFPCPDPAR